MNASLLDAVGGRSADGFVLGVEIANCSARERREIAEEVLQACLETLPPSDDNNNGSNAGGEEGSSASVDVLSLSAELAGRSPSAAAAVHHDEPTPFVDLTFPPTRRSVSGGARDDHDSTPQVAWLHSAVFGGRRRRPRGGAA